jgi:hypothetical protein
LAQWREVPERGFHSVRCQGLAPGRIPKCGSP